MPKYRKKPVVVEAEQFTAENKDRVHVWVRCSTAAVFIEGEPALKIQTLEGVMTARLGDWVIKGVEGEFYPCKPSVFEQTYELVTHKRGLYDVIEACGCLVRGIGTRERPHRIAYCDVHAAATPKQEEK